MLSPNNINDDCEMSLPNSSYILNGSSEVTVVSSILNILNSFDLNGDVSTVTCGLW